jgi:hypothetical protein
MTTKELLRHARYALDRTVALTPAERRRFCRLLRQRLHGTARRLRQP